MRIIAGQLKGLQLKGPVGRGTRPTSDLMRGVLFQMLENMAPDWSRVLDLFAGTGALGLEALSRGAEHVDFVESNAAACAIVRANVGLAGAAEQSRVYCCTVHKAFAFLAAEYGIILADPPYGMAGMEALLGRIASSAWVGPQTVLAIEHAARVELPAAIDRLRLLQSRRHGDTRISFYRAEANGA